MNAPKPGKYRMTVEVEIDQDGYLLPHDSGEMFMAAWWIGEGARFVRAEDVEVIEAGRRTQQAEQQRLTAQVQELQAKVNGLTRLHDERDAIERKRLDVSSQDTPPAPRPAPRVWVVGGDETEPTEPDLKILGSNGVTFERTSYGRWRALPPEGDGDNYGWSFLIGTVGLTFTEVLSEVVVPTDTDGRDQ